MLTNSVTRLERNLTDDPADEIETGLLEFLVEHRFVNGTQAMMIDLNRCTRCDDCIRACASTHDNNPRFVRNGPEIRFADVRQRVYALRRSRLYDRLSQPVRSIAISIPVR